MLNPRVFREGPQDVNRHSPCCCYSNSRSREEEPLPDNLECHAHRYASEEATVPIPSMSYPNPPTPPGGGEARGAQQPGFLVSPPFLPGPPAYEVLFDFLVTLSPRASQPVDLTRPPVRDLLALERRAAGTAVVGLLPAATPSHLVFEAYGRPILYCPVPECPLTDYRRGRA